MNAFLFVSSISCLCVHRVGSIDKSSGRLIRTTFSPSVVRPIGQSSGRLIGSLVSLMARAVRDRLPHTRRIYRSERACAAITCRTDFVLLCRLRFAAFAAPLCFWRPCCLNVFMRRDFVFSFLASTAHGLLRVRGTLASFVIRL